MTNVHILSIDETLTEDELNEISTMLQKAMDRADIDDQLIIINREMSGIDKEELREELND